MFLVIIYSFSCPHTVTGALPVPFSYKRAIIRQYDTKANSWLFYRWAETCSLINFDLIHKDCYN
jgi:hypothetical protein